MSPLRRATRPAPTCPGAFFGSRARSVANSAPASSSFEAFEEFLGQFQADVDQARVALQGLAAVADEDLGFGGHPLVDLDPQEVGPDVVGGELHPAVEGEAGPRGTDRSPGRPARAPRRSRPSARSRRRTPDGGWARPRRTCPARARRTARRFIKGSSGISPPERLAHGVEGLVRAVGLDLQQGPVVFRLAVARGERRPAVDQRSSLVEPPSPHRLPRRDATASDRARRPVGEEHDRARQDAEQRRDDRRHATAGPDRLDRGLAGNHA